MQWSTAHGLLVQDPDMPCYSQGLWNYCGVHNTDRDRALARLQFLGVTVFLSKQEPELVIAHAVAPCQHSWQAQRAWMAAGEQAEEGWVAIAFLGLGNLRISS